MLDTASCYVCDDVAAGKYYDAIVCNGCRAFFRRSVKHMRQFRCRKNGNCPITKVVKQEIDSNLCNDQTSSPDSLSDMIEISSEIDETSQNQPSTMASADDDHTLMYLNMIENEIWALNDNHMFACDYGKQVDVSYEFAYNNLHWVSDRYPINFNAEHILTIESMVHGWRRHFVYYVDWCTKLNEVRQLNMCDQIILTKYRISHHFWLSTAYNSIQSSMLHGHLGICIANNCYHPHAEDMRYYERNTILSKFLGNLEDVFFNQLIKPMKDLNIDYNEYLLIKIIGFFREEVGISDEALPFIHQNLTKYIRTLYMYIYQKLSDPLMASERMSNILMLLPVLTTLRLMMNERVTTSSIFNMHGFDHLFKETHSSDVHTSDENSNVIRFFVWEVLRHEEFSPLKNPDHIGCDCITTCCRDFSAECRRWLNRAGIEIPSEHLVYISPLISYAGEGLSKDLLLSNNEVFKWFGY